MTDLHILTPEELRAMLPHASEELVALNCSNSSNSSDRGAVVGKASSKQPKAGKGTGRPNKYHAQPTEYNGVRYGSKKEATFAANLDWQTKHGQFSCWLRQVPFDLPGGARHRVDFMTIDYDSVVTFYEVKGRDLPMGKLKRKQVEELYHIHIEVV